MKLQRVVREVCKDSIIRSAYGSQDQILEACCRALWVNNFSERWLPSSPQEPYFEDCLNLIKLLAMANSDDEIRDLSGLRNVTLCLVRARDAC
jgi:hypothetical protein